MFVVFLSFQLQYPKIGTRYLVNRKNDKSAKNGHFQCLESVFMAKNGYWLFSGSYFLKNFAFYVENLRILMQHPLYGAMVIILFRFFIKQQLGEQQPTLLSILLFFEKIFTYSTKIWSIFVNCHSLCLQKVS